MVNQMKCSTLFMLLISGNMHSVTYNQNLVSPTLLAGWTELKEFCGLIGNHQVTLTHYGHSVFLLTSLKVALNQKLSLNDTPCTIKFLTQSLLRSSSDLDYLICISFAFQDVSSTMYSFMKTVGFIHPNLEETECRIVYNHHRKTAKIGNG
ncbi:hypothetical protein HKD37_18G051338 [Glycine soja]